jgi:hypothetical protein
MKGSWGNLGRQEEKEKISINGLRLMEQNWPQTLTFKNNNPYGAFIHVLKFTTFTRLSLYLHQSLEVNLSSKIQAS